MKFLAITTFIILTLKFENVLGQSKCSIGHEVIHMNDGSFYETSLKDYTHNEPKSTEVLRIKAFHIGTGINIQYSGNQRNLYFGKYNNCFSILKM